MTSFMMDNPLFEKLDLILNNLITIKGFEEKNINLCVKSFTSEDIIRKKFGKKIYF